jgi:hypothetical protein
MHRISIPALIVLLLTTITACSENPVADDGRVSTDDIQLRISDSGDYLSTDALNDLTARYLDRLGVDATVVDASAKGRPSMEMATGSGHLHDTRFAPDNYRTFAFVAIEKDDTRTMGQWELYTRGPDVRLHGNVECLEVVGNTAWFAGRTTESTLESEIGSIRGFRVVDGDVDEVSLTPEYLTAEGYCATGPPVPMLDVERGNVTVH